MDPIAHAKGKRYVIGTTLLLVPVPVLTGPDTLRNDIDTDNFIPCASLVACISRGNKRTNMARFAWYTPPGTVRGTCVPRL